MIPVIWHENPLSDDHRARYAHCTLINEMFDAVGGFEHYGTWPSTDMLEEAVVVIHGGNERGKEDRIKWELDWHCKRAIVMVLGDEESVFKTRKLVSPNRKLWQQMPTPGLYDYCDRFVIEGYPGDLHRLKSQWTTEIPKDLDWFFAGQVTHSRRRECVRYMPRCPNGTLIQTKHFFQEVLPREDYYRTMARAKVVPCPGGPTSPDTFRLSEALELGCIPIADDMPGSRPMYPGGYWKYIFGKQPPFPVLYEWSMGPFHVTQALVGWELKSKQVFSWWQEYKRSYRDWLVKDLEELRCASRS